MRDLPALSQGYPPGAGCPHASSDGQDPMRQRRASRLGTAVSEIGFGAWAIGGTWGEVSERDAQAALNAALDAGVTFIDTADVYGDGRSETIIGRRAEGARRQAARSSRPRPAARLRQQVAEGYTKANLEGFIDRQPQAISASTRSTSCSSTARRRDVYYLPEVFDDPRRPRGQDGKIEALRRQRREGRGGAEGDRISQRRLGPDHLQHLPPAPGSELFFREAKAKKRRDHRPRAAGKRAC